MNLKYLSEKINFLENSPPIKFIDNLNGPKHIVQFYEDSEYAKIVKFRFIKNGLEKKQFCIYIANEQENIKTVK